MRIRTIRVLLCLLAASTLTISSCQKEEELLPGSPAAVAPATAQQNNETDSDVCGSILSSDPVEQSHMQAVEQRVQEFIRNNPDVVAGGSRTIINIPVVFHVVY